MRERLLLVICLTLTPGCQEEQGRFSKGVHPVVFDETRDALRSEAGQVYPDALSCRECHKDQYDNWYRSRHRAAFTNELYAESHKREHMTWCVNCHAPLMRPGGNPDSTVDRVHPEEGISCNVCHVREGRVLVSKVPDPVPGKERVHRYTVSSAMGTEKICESCHQFNFPDAATMAGVRTFRYADLVMQNTVQEWRSSGFRGTTCQGCHLLAGSTQTHSFPGGHDLARVADAIAVRFQRVGRTRTALEVYSSGIGHAFPTGDLFRTLKVRVYVGGVQIFEAVLRKEYLNVMPDQIQPDEPMKRLASDTTIAPPGKGEFSSMRVFYFDADSRITQLRYEVRMDYLHGFNHLTTELPLEKTQPLVESGDVKIEPGKSEPGTHG